MNNPHELIGQRAVIVGYSETGAAMESGTVFVAHVCLDLCDGRRVFFQATDEHGELTIVTEPGGSAPNRMNRGGAPSRS